MVYEATPNPDGERNYRLLAEVLAQHLLATSERPGEAAVNAGRSWAGLTELGVRNSDELGRPTQRPVSAKDTLEAVVQMLGDIGFAPELSADRGTVSLHRCPFRELAECHPDVGCGAHLEMVQGALAGLASPVRATPLLPLVEPDLCIITLSGSGAGR